MDAHWLSTQGTQTDDNKNLNAFIRLIVEDTGDIEGSGMQLFNFGDPTGESELGFDWVHTIGMLGRLRFVNQAVNPTANNQRRFHNANGVAWSPTGAGSFDERWRFTFSGAKNAVDFFSLLIHNGDISQEEKALAEKAYLRGGANKNLRLRAVIAYLLSMPGFEKQ